MKLFQLTNKKTRERWIGKTLFLNGALSKAGWSKKNVWVKVLEENFMAEIVVHLCGLNRKNSKGKKYEHNPLEMRKI